MRKMTINQAQGGTDMPGMLTAKDLGAALKIDPKTIYKYVQFGRIPYVRIQRNIRFPKRGILDWLEAQTYRPRSRNGRLDLRN